jgi:trk system potassium uptake protein
MYIIVVGGGNVGFYLTKDLVAANHEVLLLEKDRVRAQRLAEELGTVVQQGDGCEAKVMAEMQFQKADIVVAVTGEDEDNLVVCQMAKKKFHVARTIARVNSPANEELFSQLGIDTTVSATRLIFNLIESEIQSDQPIPVAALARGNLEIVSIDLSERSPVVGRAAIVRRGKGLLPSPHAILQTGDDVLALVNRDEEDSLRQIFCELQ